MRNINTISFDLWGTLIKANPNYSLTRLEIIKKYNTELTDERITFVLKSVKNDFDELVEKYGIQHSTDTLYSAIFSKLDIHYGLWNRLIRELEKSFIKNPPIIIDNTLETLNELKDKDYRLILISNTLLIKGEILSKSLSNLMSFFNEEHYSDELKVSKPNINIFSIAYDNKCDVVHIGDNKTTDIFGANRYGIDALHINGSSDKTILDVIPFLNSLNN